MGNSEHPDIDEAQTTQVDSSASIPPPRTDETLSLSDGRTLGYAEYGPVDGDPLVFCHGTPGSRYTRHPDASFLEEHGIRQVTVERPGYGRSTYDSKRDLLDWPDDVREAADTLGFDRFAIAGISGGGPHALACAARIPDRLTGVAILNGIGPLDAPGATDGMALKNRLSFKISGLPLIPRLRSWLAVRQIKKDADAVIDALGDSFADVDEQLLQRPEVRAMLRQDLTEAVRQGTDGWVREGRILARSWGFELAKISTHVDLWHGELDMNAPVTMGRYVADEVPSCTAHIYPDEGHLLMVDYWGEILSTLTERPRDGTTES